MKNYKLELSIITISIFLQAFAIIKTSSFGISLWILLMVYVALKYEVDYSNKSLKQFISTNLEQIWHTHKKFILFNVIFVVFIIISYLLNKSAINYIKIIRIEMLIFSAYIFYSYLKRLNNIQVEYMYKNIYISTIILTVYSVYQYFSYFFNGPLFLNIFRNNPSYNSKVNFYDYYGGGWIQNRIYGISSEPSFYGSFLVILLIIFILNKTYSRYKKNVAIALIILNLIFTFARSAYMELMYILIGYAMFKVFEKYKLNIGKKVLIGITVMIPIFNISILYFANKFIFKDASSDARTNSVLYYLRDSFISFKSFIIGHGLGSIQQNIGSVKSDKLIEAFAHNGYVEVLNEMGIIGVAFIAVALIYLIRNIKNNSMRYLATLVVVVPNTFRTNFYIETLLATMILILFIIELEDKQKQCLVE